MKIENKDIYGINMKTNSILIYDLYHNSLMWSNAKNKLNKDIFSSFILDRYDGDEVYVIPELTQRNLNKYLLLDDLYDLLENGYVDQKFHLIKYLYNINKAHNFKQIDTINISSAELIDEYGLLFLKGYFNAVLESENLEREVEIHLSKNTIVIDKNYKTISSKTLFELYNDTIKSKLLSTISALLNFENYNAYFYYEYGCNSRYIFKTDSQQLVIEYNNHEIIGTTVTN